MMTRGLLRWGAEKQRGCYVVDQCSVAGRRRVSLGTELGALTVTVRATRVTEDSHITFSVKKEHIGIERNRLLQVCHTQQDFGQQI